MIELHVYLKGIKKPVVLLLDKEKQVDEFYDLILTNDVVKFGQLIFKRDEFIYAIMEV